MIDRIATADTIAAIATATGGAVGIVRISGPNAHPILRALAPKIEVIEPRKLHYVALRDPKDGSLIDRALAVYFRAPNTFTGEDIVELQGHGGALVMRRLLEACLAAGARQAEPGEFTYRAFRNGKLDLAQAEAVAEVIMAESDFALQAAQAQLGGALSEPIKALRRGLLDLAVLVEASIDFSTEEHVYQLPIAEARSKLALAQRKIEKLLHGFELGQQALGGAKVVLVGAPNVGKSSLFNAMLGQDRAIVTAQAGTTRDLLHGRTRLKGQSLQLVDTAGLRRADDIVEKIGVDRSLDEARQADFLCWILDASLLDAPSIAQLELPPEIASHPRAPLLVINKSDCLAPQERAKVEAELGFLSTSLKTEVIWSSCIAPGGLDALETSLAQRVRSLEDARGGDLYLLTSTRHAQALGRALEAIERADLALEEALPWELIGADLGDATLALGEIIGAIATDDLLDEIFSSFCVGK